MADQQAQEDDGMLAAIAAGRVGIAAPDAGRSILASAREGGISAVLVRESGPAGSRVVIAARDDRTTELFCKGSFDPRLRQGSFLPGNEFWFCTSRRAEFSVVAVVPTLARLRWVDHDWQGALLAVTSRNVLEFELEGLDGRRSIWTGVEEFPPWSDVTPGLLASHVSFPFPALSAEEPVVQEIRFLPAPQRIILAYADGRALWSGRFPERSKPSMEDVVAEVAALGRVRIPTFPGTFDVRDERGGYVWLRGV